MKRHVITVLLVLFSVLTFAQAPESFNFQAVVRDAGGNVLVNTPVQADIKIWKDGPIPMIVFEETHFVTTNGFGLINIQVGSDSTAQMEVIDWSSGIYLIEVIIDGISLSTTQLLSVPYALHSKTADNITGGYTESDPVFTASPANGITTTDITSWNNKLDTEADGSVTNELQVLSISNDTVYLSDGGFVKLPAGFSGNYSDLTGAPSDVSAFNNDAGYLTLEVDGDVTNELQVLSINNDTIYLSDGGFVKLPAGFSGDYSDLTGAPVDVSAFNNDAGYLTSEIDGSVTNELQVLSISNDTIYLSDGGFVKLPVGFSGDYSDLTGAPTSVSVFTNDAGYLISEVDGSVTNELQALTISNDTIYLSNGGYVKLPAGFDGQYSNLTGAPTNVSTFTNDAGYLTNFIEKDTMIWKKNISDIYFNSGNVGIGTTNPGSSLEVAGQIKITGGIPGLNKVLTSDATGLASWSTINSVGAWTTSGNSGTLAGTNFLGTTDNVDLVVKRGGSEQLRFQNNDIRIPNGVQVHNTGTTINEVIGLTNDYGIGLSLANKNNGGSGSVALQAQISSYGFSYGTAGHFFYGSRINPPAGSYGIVVNNTSTNGVGARIDVAGSGTTMTGLYINASGGTNNYALLVNNGNVGIGTVSPTTKLEVSGGLKVTGGLNTDKNITLRGGNNSSTAIGGDISITGGDGYNMRGGIISINAGYTSSWSSAGTSSDVTIKGGEMEGFGYSQIIVGGGKSVSGGSTSADGGVLTLQGGNANGSNRNGGNIILTPGTQTGTGTIGNVGIGTSSPSQKLDVQGGNVNTSGNVMTGGTARIDATGNLINIGNITATGATTYTSGAGTLLKLQGGNSASAMGGGINLTGGTSGNNIAGAVVSLNGGPGGFNGTGGAVTLTGGTGGQSGGSGAFITINGGGPNYGPGGNLILSSGLESPGNWWDVGHNGAVIMAINGTEYMRIDGDRDGFQGFVGIGTSTPQRVLHVNDVMRLEPRATAPASPSKGDIYFDSTDNILKVYDGTAWRSCW